MFRNHTPGIGIRIILAFVAALAWGCAGGSSGSAATGLSPSTSPQAPAAGISGSWTPNGRLYARVELAIPAGDASDANAFTLRATVPVPKDFLSSSTQSWVAIVDMDGTLVPAQIERVSRYATEENAVVELIARVHRAAATTPGTRVLFDAVGIDFTAGLPPSSGPALNVPAEMEAVANGSRKMLVAAWDVFGNLYLGAPFSKDHVESFRAGPYLETYRTYHTMIPVTGGTGPNAPLPALLGLHAYVTLGADRAIGLDLRFHNGLVADTPAQQATIGNVYFEKIELWLPDEMTARADLEDPFFDLAGAHPASFDGRNYNAIPLVKALPNGAMHFVPKQGQFHRRLAIAMAGEDAAALSLVNQEGLAFVRPGVDPATGEELYSWWNPATANYLPQRFPLPNLDFWGTAAARNKLAQKYNTDRSIIVQGAAPGGDWISGSLGWANPNGSPYGGMTGGAGIHLFQGVLEVYAASEHGIRDLMLRHRAREDRNPVALYYPDGSPVSVEKLVKTNAQGNLYLPTGHFFLNPQGQGDGYFALNKPPTAHEAFVASQGLKPPYEAALASYAPDDLQHRIRYVGDAIVLAWVANDALAKDDLGLSANLARLSFPEIRSSANNAVAGLLAQFFRAQGNPGFGLAYGRGEGWELYTAAAYYALSDDAWRGSMQAWFQMQAATLSQGQVGCTGIIEAKPCAKSPDKGKKWNIRQVFEDMITQNGALAAWKSVYDGRGLAEETLLRVVVTNLSQSIIVPVGWIPNHGPLGQQATSAIGMTPPIFCTSLPPDGTNNHANLFQTGSAFGHGFVLTGDSSFLSKAVEAFGGSMTALQADLEDTKWTTNNYPNTAALLRVMQDLNWTQP